VVTLEEIAANDHNLNIPRYVEPQVTQKCSASMSHGALEGECTLLLCGEERLISIFKREGLLSMIRSRCLSVPFKGTARGTAALGGCWRLILSCV